MTELVYFCENCDKIVGTVDEGCNNETFKKEICMEHFYGVDDFSSNTYENKLCCPYCGEPSVVEKEMTRCDVCGEYYPTICMEDTTELTNGGIGIVCHQCYEDCEVGN